MQQIPDYESRAIRPSRGAWAGPLLAAVALALGIVGPFVSNQVEHAVFGTARHGWRDVPFWALMGISAGCAVAALVGIRKWGADKVVTPAVIALAFVIFFSCMRIWPAP